MFRLKDIRLFLLIISLFSTIYLAFYFPFYGFILNFTSNYKNLLYAVGIRSLLISFFLFLIFFSKKIFKKNLLYFMTIFYLILEFLRSENKIGGIIYLLNSFFPVFLFLIVLHFTAKYRFKGKYEYFKKNDSILILRIVFVVMLVVYIIDLIYGFYFLQLQEIFHPKYVLAIKHKGHPFEGLYHPSWFSIIGNNCYLRFLGIFPDAIKNGYFLALFFILIFHTKLKPKIFKIYFSLFLLSSLVFTLCKGALCLLVIYFVTYFLVKLNYIRRFSFYIVYILIILFLLIIASFYFPGSNTVHVLGLINALYFLSDSSILETLLGKGLGFGGNLAVIYTTSGNWIKAGAESGVGVVLTNLGLIGFCLYSFYFFSLWRILLKENNKCSNMMVSLLLSLYVLSFLQEDLINSSIWSMFFLIITISVYYKEIYNKTT
ncbi:hypothetical protein [Thermodesulfatator autotrophicus]|uniref:hypothetical protein n=1 Tax=Thermodesulfatator autotrophicus TaxID=1795632 RepID=UPI0012FB11C2|nr:hypothetical protein [Thermodesulfatator autotrophicus]